MTLTMDVRALAAMSNAELEAAIDRLKAARAQMERDLEALEGERDRRARVRRDLQGGNSVMTRITGIKGYVQ
jgi:hypothetical protein